MLASLTLARIAFGMQLQTVAALAPMLERAFGIDYATLGTLIGLYMAPGIVVAMASGLLGRRLGEGPVLGVGLALMTLGSCVSSLLPGTFGIGVGRLVAGTGAVTLSVLLGKIVADAFAGPRFVLAMGITVGAFPVGVGLSQAVMPAMAEAFGWRVALLAGAALSGVATLLFVVSFRGGDAPGPRHFALPSPRECLLVLLAGLVWTTYNAAYFGFLSYGPSLLSVRGAGAGETAVVMTLATWPNVVAVLLGSAAAPRLGLMRLFNIGTAAQVLSLLGFVLWDRPVLTALVFGTLGSVHSGVIMAVGTLSARPQHRAVGMGVFYTTYYIGGALFPALCGQAADHFHTPAAALLAAAALSVPALPLFWWHQRRAPRP
ncbi:MAG: MFS transporter [Acidisphaera sp.]|nr:MFS transporter [Acidisphaera sp.]